MKESVIGCLSHAFETDSWTFPFIFYLIYSWETCTLWIRISRMFTSPAWGKVFIINLFFNSHFRRLLPNPQLSLLLQPKTARHPVFQTVQEDQDLKETIDLFSFDVFFQFRPRDVLQGICLLSFHKLRIHMLKLKGECG